MIEKYYCVPTREIVRQRARKVNKIGLIFSEPSSGIDSKRNQCTNYYIIPSRSEKSVELRVAFLEKIRARSQLRI